jgi:hypothetical protein
MCFHFVNDIPPLGLVDDDKIQFLMKGTFSLSRSVPYSDGASQEEKENHPFILLAEYIFSKAAKICNWKRNCGKKLTSDILTMTDEAFAYLVLENSWDVWFQRYVTFKNEEIPKYLQIKCVYTNNGGVGARYGGWSSQGYTQFNVYYEKIVMMRSTQNSIDLEETFRKMQAAKMDKATVDTTSKCVCKRNSPKCVHCI